MEAKWTALLLHAATMTGLALVVDSGTGCLVSLSDSM